jgi:hypothetical protein
MNDRLKKTKKEVLPKSKEKFLAEDEYMSKSLKRGKERPLSDSKLKANLLKRAKESYIDDDDL